MVNDITQAVVNENTDGTVATAGLDIHPGDALPVARNAITARKRDISPNVAIPVADPGFPVGGALTCWGGANLRCIHFSAKTCVKTKEIDPVGGGAHASSAPWIHQCIQELVHSLTA